MTKLDPMYVTDQPHTCTLETVFETTCSSRRSYDGLPSVWRFVLKVPDYPHAPDCINMLELVVDTRSDTASDVLRRVMLVYPNTLDTLHILPDGVFDELVSLHKREPVHREGANLIIPLPLFGTHETDRLPIVHGMFNDIRLYIDFVPDASIDEKSVKIRGLAYRLLNRGASQEYHPLVEFLSAQTHCYIEENRGTVVKIPLNMIDDAYCMLIGGVDDATRVTFIIDDPRLQSDEIRFDAEKKNRAWIIRFSDARPGTYSDDTLNLSHIDGMFLEVTFKEARLCTMQCYTVTAGVLRCSGGMIGKVFCA